MRRLAAVTSLVCAAALFVPPVPAAARPADDVAPGASPTAPARPGAQTRPDRVIDPDRQIGRYWRASAGRAVTTSGDETGLHVLVAEANKAYQWRTVATLAEPGLDTDQWIGQLCVTGSGQRAVVVYAPRQFTNRESLMQRGGFAAVVDLRDGTVTKLAERVSLAYHNPGCGAGETAVLSRLEVPESGDAATWLGTVNTAAPAKVSAVRTPGQVTSALPYAGGVLAVKGRSLVTLDGAKATAVASLSGTPFRLLADGAAGVAFQVARAKDTDLARFSGGKVTTVATVPLGTVKLRPGAGGHVYAVGGKATSRTRGKLPAGWRAVDAPPDSSVSTTGDLVVTSSSTGREAAGNVASGAADGAPDQVAIAGTTANGTKLAFSVLPAVSATGRAPSPALGGRSAPAPAAPLDDDNSTSTVDLDRSCAVPRNDPQIQVFQPTVKQVVWAADLAVRGMLTFERPANWSNNHLPAYSPQGYFPSLPLAGGGFVPSQILLSILAQESNLYQASPHAVDASVGNPHTSLGFYGIGATANPDLRVVDWAHTDCGYGAGQVTTGMRRADTDQLVNGVVMTYEKQKAVALDYAANIAASLRLLQAKWNETRGAGLRVNDGDPRYLENWWFAVWAYNTGYWPAGNPVEPEGLGWANNVANQDYPADRQMFLAEPLDVPEKGIDDQIGYDNAKHPNDWSYPERVMGFAYTSLRRYDYREREWAPTYPVALTNGGDPQDAQPGRFTFCSVTVNDCDPQAQHVPGDFPGTKPGACLRDDLRCRWTGPVSWLPDCDGACGVEQRTYFTVDPRPFVEDGDNIHPTPVNPDGTCLTNVVAGAKIIDDIETSEPLGLEGCRPTFTRGGTFGFRFGSVTGPSGTTYPSKVDFHQIGAGLGGHFWFAHTIQQTDPATGQDNTPLKVTGTWTIDPTNAWTRIFVHVPDHGAHTRQADYKIYLPGQTTPTHHRAIPTRWEQNRWLDIGVFDFTGAGTPKVELSNVTKDGAYTQDIAWDAIAVQPLPAKPRHFVVGMGDSYSSGEGQGDYTRVSDQYGDDPPNKNACHRSSHAWARQIVPPFTPGGETVGALSDEHDPNMDFHLVACSGAHTHNVMSTTNLDGTPAPANASGQLPGGQEGELSQIDQGFLDENTTLVVLTIGGNDALWTAVISACAFNDCLDPDFIAAGDSARLTEAVPDRLRTKVKPDVRRVIDEIRQRAPDAWIVLNGYPQIFQTGGSYGVQVLPGVVIGVTHDEVSWLNDMARIASTEVLYSDIDHKINSIDVRAYFAGRELDTSPDTLPWLNGPVIGGGANDDGVPEDAFFNPASFHPTIDGANAYARAMNDQLLVLPYQW